MNLDRFYVVGWVWTGRRDQVCAVCNDAQIVFDAEEGKYGRIGEPTEAALSVLVEKLGVPGENWALFFFLARKRANNTEETPSGSHLC